MNRSRTAAFGMGILLALSVGEAGSRWILADLDLGDDYRIARTPTFSDLDAARPPLYTDTRIHTDDRGVTIDRGVDGTRFASWARPPDTLRVTCVGDSLTAHWPEDGHRNYTDALAQSLQGEHRAVEVLALGVSGYSPWQALAWFAQDFERLESDALVLQLGPNDIDDTSVGVPRGLGRFFVSGWPGAEVRGRNHKRPAFTARARLLWLMDHWLVGAWLGDRNRHLSLAQSPLQLHDALRGFRDLTRERNIELLAVVFPFFAEHHTPLEEDVLIETLADLDISTLRLTGILQAAGDLDDLGLDGIHPTPQGHQIAGAAIAQRLHNP